MVDVPVTPPIDIAIVGAPTYFERHGLPETPDDLMRHNCLAYPFTSSGTIDRWSFTSPDAEGCAVLFKPKGNAMFNDHENMLNAAVQGVRLIKYLDLCVRQHLADGRLVRVLAPWCRPLSGFYLYVPSRAQMPAETRALMDFLVERRQQLARQSIKAVSMANQKRKRH